MSVVQCERKTFRLISLSTPVNFRWTVSFILEELLKASNCLTQLHATVHILDTAVVSTGD
jgi:hypothetical protein